MKKKWLIFVFIILVLGIGFIGCGDGSDNDNSNKSTPTPPKVSAPDTPTGLSAEAISTSSITITWDPVLNASGYYFYRVTGPNSISYDVKRILFTNSYTDNDLEHNTTYYYSVEAYNNYGTSRFSNTVSATTKLIPVGTAWKSPIEIKKSSTFIDYSFPEDSNEVWFKSSFTTSCNIYVRDKAYTSGTYDSDVAVSIYAINNNISSSPVIVSDLNEKDLGDDIKYFILSSLSSSFFASNINTFYIRITPMNNDIENKGNFAISIN